ncbi:hypothetical protein BH23PLA1_BH23PLA1_06910 [soil metagenome]
MTQPLDENPESTPGSAPSPTEARQYEFAPEEEHIIGALAGKMRFVGLLIMFIGVLALLYAALSVMGSPAVTAPLLVVGVAAVLLILIGIWTQKAGSEFLLVEETVGKDISHLLKALANLHKLYALQYWIGWASLILLIIAMVFGYFIDPAH